MSDRDPRSNPAPGDRLSIGGVVRVVVTCPCAGSGCEAVHYRCPHEGHGWPGRVEGEHQPYRVGLDQWRRSMKRAEVLSS